MGLLSDLGNVLDPGHIFIPEERDPSKYPRAGSEELQLRDTAQQMRSTAGAFAPVLRQRLAELADPSARATQARGRGNADVMQQARGGTPLQRAMTRGRALTRVALQGDQAVQGQALRDRIGMSRLGSSMLAGTTRELAGMADNSAEITAAKMRGQQEISAANANFAGSALGGVGRMFQGRRGSYYVPDTTVDFGSEGGGSFTNFAPRFG